MLFAQKISEHTKGYRLLTLICPIMVYLDVVVELKIPTVMGEVTDILVSLQGESYVPADITSQLTSSLSKCFCFAA